MEGCRMGRNADEKGHMGHSECGEEFRAVLYSCNIRSAGERWELVIWEMMCCKSMLHTEEPVRLHTGNDPLRNPHADWITLPFLTNISACYTHFTWKQSTELIGTERETDGKEYREKISSVMLSLAVKWKPCTLNTRLFSLFKWFIKSSFVGFVGISPDTVFLKKKKRS